MKNLIKIVMIFPFVVSCSFKAIPLDDDSAYVEKPPKYISYLESSLDSKIEPERQLAQTELEKLEVNTPPAEDVEKYLEYLVLLDASGKQAEAEKKIKQFLANNPSEKRGLFILSVHYLRRNKKELATYFMHQLESDSGFVWQSLLLNNFGMLALQEKNRVKAIDYFEKAIRQKPEVSAPFANLGALYLQSKNYKKAENMFQKAYEIDSDFEAAALGLGVSLEGQGKFEEAHKVYTAFMQKNQNALNIVYNDALILGNNLKRSNEAAEQMLRYIQRGGKETARAHEAMQNWR